jgi:hypothetical protein
MVKGSEEEAVAAVEPGREMMDTKAKVGGSAILR